MSTGVFGTSHEPVGYDCPFCRFRAGTFDDRNAPTDLVVERQHAFARIAPKWWPRNDGSVLVVPHRHVENLYDLSRTDGHAVWDLVRDVSVAMRRSYGCDGVTVRQHNEPAGDQDVWHLHVHVLPRYAGDDLYRRHFDARWVATSERRPYAERLAAALDEADNG